MFENKIPILGRLLNGGDDRTQRFKRNTLGVVVIKYSSILLELLKVPILLSYLDNEKYGVWLTIVSLVLWTQQFDFGLGAGLRFKMTESIAHNDNKRCKELVSTAYTSLSVVMFVAFIVLALSLYFLNWNSVLNVSTISNSELYYSVVSVLFLFLIRFVLELVCVILNADQRTATSTLFLPISTLLSLICIFLLKYLQPNSLFLASVFMILPYVVVLLIANIFYFIKDYALYKPSIGDFRKSALKDIYSMGLKYFVSQFASLVVFSSSNIIITQVLSPSDVAVYNTARQYYYLPITFVSLVLLSFASPVTEAYIKGDFQWIKNMMRKFKWLALASTVGVFIMLICSDFIFNIWTGGRIEVTFALSLAFVIYAILNVFATPYVEFLTGAGKLEVRMWLGLFKILTFIPVSLLLMRLWGLVGLVVAICLINTSINGIFGYIQYKMIINNRAKGIWDK